MLLMVSSASAACGVHGLPGWLGCGAWLDGGGMLAWQVLGLGLRSYHAARCTTCMLHHGGSYPFWKRDGWAFFLKPATIVGGIEGDMLHAALASAGQMTKHGIAASRA